jgi:hypothetical protein
MRDPRASRQGPRMSAPKPPFEIVPGESIGPARLGMTRERIRALGLDPEAALGALESYGFTFVFDDRDHCIEIQVATGPELVLGGRPLGKAIAEVDAAIALHAPNGGLKAHTWERSDDWYSLVSVVPI